MPGNNKTVIVSCLLATSVAGYFIYKYLKNKNEKKEEDFFENQFSEEKLDKSKMKVPLKSICGIYRDITNSMIVLVDQLESVRDNLKSSEISEAEIQEFFKEKFNEVLHQVETQVVNESGFAFNDYLDTCNYLQSTQNITFTKYSYGLLALYNRISNKPIPKPNLPSFLTEEYVKDFCQTLYDIGLKSLENACTDILNNGVASNKEEIIKQNAENSEFKHAFIDLYTIHDSKLRRAEYEQRHLAEIDYENALIYYEFTSNFKEITKDFDLKRMHKFEEYGIKNYL